MVKTHSLSIVIYKMTDEELPDVENVQTVKNLYSSKSVRRSVSTVSAGLRKSLQTSRAQENEESPTVYLSFTRKKSNHCSGYRSIIVYPASAFRGKLKGRHSWKRFLNLRWGIWLMHKSSGKYSETIEKPLWHTHNVVGEGLKGTNAPIRI